jgi:hypothetical protein
MARNPHTGRRRPTARPIGPREEEGRFTVDLGVGQVVVRIELDAGDTVVSRLTPELAEKMADQLLKGARMVRQQWMGTLALVPEPSPCDDLLAEAMANVCPEDE